MRLFALSAVVANMSTLVLTLVSSSLRVKSSLVSKRKKKNCPMERRRKECLPRHFSYSSLSSVLLSNQQLRRPLFQLGRFEHRLQPTVRILQKQHQQQQHLLHACDASVYQSVATRVEAWWNNCNDKRVYIAILVLDPLFL